MRKAKDERVKIAAAFFRDSFDEEDDEENEDKAPLAKESEKTLSQTTSNGDSTKAKRKSSVTNTEVFSKLIAPNPELAVSTLKVEDRTFKHLQSFENSSSSNNVNERAISGRSNAREEYNRDNDVISKVEMRRLAMLMTDSDSVFPAPEHEDVIAKESSARFQSLSIKDHPMRARTKPIAMDRSEHSQLMPDFLEVPSETSEASKHFITLLERASIKECSDVRKVCDTVPQPSLIVTVQDSFDEKSNKSSGRRSTLPMTSSDLNQSTLHEQNSAMETSQKSPTFEDILAGTSVNPIRKFSIANAAICSSLAPSLLGAIPGVPNSLLPNGNYGDSNLQRSVTLSNLSTTSTAISDDISIGKTRRGLRSFLRLHIPEPHPATWHDTDEDYYHHLHQHNHHHHHHHHHVFSHIHVPTITFTAPATDGIGRKFNFAIRRHSHAVSVKSGCTSFRHLSLLTSFFFFY